MASRNRSATPRSGSFWLFSILIGISLLLLFALTWQSVRAARSNVKIAESVLHDYSELAVEQYALHLKQYFGYWWSYQLGLLITEQFEAVEDGQETQLAIGEDAPPTLAAASAALGTIYRLDRNGGRIRILQGEPLVDSRRLFEIVDENTGRDRFLVRHLEAADGGIVLVVLYPVTGKPYWYGVSYFPSAVVNRLRLVFENWPLLPAPLARDLENNRGIQIRLQAPSGEILFESSEETTSLDSDRALKAELNMADDYQGLFADYRISATLDPGLADQLIIGGMPKSRLPTLIALMVLTQIVLVAIFWVLYKERAVARMRNDFVSRVSHEFRTPLTQIRMFAETLLLGREKTPDDRRNQLNIINREAKRLSHLVSNVLTLAGQERKQVRTDLQPVRICALLVEIIEEYRSMLVHSATAIELSGCSGIGQDIRAKMDPEAFVQVMINLLDNACKYGPEGQTVRVSFKPEHDFCRIAIEDHGPGIPEHEREKIWQLYYRLDREEARAINGTGIGLPIARELLAAMHGECHVETADAGGARFVVKLEKVQP